MDRILLVENEESCWRTVKFALDDKYEVVVADTLDKALKFLREEGHTLQGALVDLHLTKGTDFYGEQVLTALSRLGVPRAIFTSADLRLQRDGSLGRTFTERFGVVDTILKREDGGVRLDDVEACVARLVGESFAARRRRATSDVESYFADIMRQLDVSLQRVDKLEAELRKAAGRRAATARTQGERETLIARRELLNSTQTSLLERIAASSSEDEVEALLTEAKEICGVGGTG